MPENVKCATRRTVGDAMAKAASVAEHPPAKACRGCSDCANGAAAREARRNAKQTEAIRFRAYELWRQAGRPGGDGIEFWLAAERESPVAN
ncbi:MAG TPA: DUF2934 domain-containing protein [Planctomycetia bacterium]|nr:DUF2934 domain-containing protein [Planctomycetia bacterium]